MKYYVNGKSQKSGDGSRENPFSQIQEAANVAKAGDEVIVAPGIYREAVSPVYAGEENNRIVYRSEVDKKAVITGAEPMKDWQQVNGNVWMCEISNQLFGDCNPYTTLVSGDWFVATMIAHIGEVYLNHKSMYEVTDYEEVINPRKSVVSWDPDFSVYTWYTKQDEEKDKTIIYANFQGKNPNEEDVEISVRKMGTMRPRKTAFPP